MSDLNEQLAACPFCGSADISAGEVLTTWGAGKTNTQSMCTGCGALGPEASVPDGEEVDYGDIRAIAAWNRRAPAAAPIVQPVGDLFTQIMNIPCRPRRGEHPSVIAYKAGHRDARHAAAELVAAALQAPVVQAEPAGEVVSCEDYGLTIRWKKGAPTVGTFLYAAPTTAAADAKDAARWRGILEAVLREMPKREAYGRPGNAPGHGHEKPGIWDGDNGPLAGTECAWCKVWNEARAAIATSADEVKS